MTQIVNYTNIAPRMCQDAGFFASLEIDFEKRTFHFENKYVNYINMSMPRTIGYEASGTIEQQGPNITLNETTLTVQYNPRRLLAMGGNTGTEVFKQLTYTENTVDGVLINPTIKQSYIPEIWYKKN